MATSPLAKPSASPTLLRWSATTHAGRVRPNNEDTFLALTFDGHGVRFLGKHGEATLADADFVFAVSDGMGGAKSGEFASRITVDRITKLLPRSFHLSAMGMASGFPDIIGELFTSIHRDLSQLGQSYEECAGMGATLSLCWFTRDWMYFGHIGDSRIYYLPRDGGVTQVTHDHSHVGWLRRKGQLTEYQARSHPGRNALQQALGAGNQFIEPHIGSVGWQPGDQFLLCSDGLVDGLWDRQIEEFMRTPVSPTESPTRAERIVHESVNTSGRDNTTAISIELHRA
jgi:serine/threonine protein phosphatase PrpC